MRKKCKSPESWLDPEFECESGFILHIKQKTA
jgi:hypothetical protein